MYWISDTLGIGDNRMYWISDTLGIGDNNVLDIRY